MLELRKDGEKIRVSTGINVMTAFWDGNVKTIKQGCPDYFLISQKLLSFNAIVAKRL
jgi:hypothetical protein